jgi:hypothetical protein
MTVVIADTSPVNYLLLIGEIAILPRLYGQVLIPPEVLAELSDADAPPQVLQWVRLRPTWMMIQRYGNSIQASGYTTRTAGSWGAIVDRRRGGSQRGDSARYSEYGNSRHTQGRGRPSTARPSLLIEEFGCDQFPGFATSYGGTPGRRYRTQTAPGPVVGIAQVENRSFYGRA